MFRYKFLFLLLFLITRTEAQTTVDASPGVERMMGKMISRGKANESIKAWRVQIITTDNRRQMEAARAKFKLQYPDVSMDWKHVAPYYQVRVGYFESKNKLMPFLLEIKEEFPSATPVYDNVKKRDLVDY